MNTIKLPTSTHPTPARDPRRRGFLDSLRTLLQGWSRSRQRARDEAVLHGLDEATWRDIGLRPSELGSYWAELDGRAEVTRTRVMQSVIRERRQ